MNNKPDVFNVFCKVMKNWIAFSQEKSTPSVRLKCRHVNQGDADAEAGNIIYYANLFLTELTIENTTETLFRCFGWRGSICEIQKNPLLFAGRPCVLVIERDGMGYEQVRYVNPDTSSRDENQAAQVRALAVWCDAKMKKHWERDARLGSLERKIDSRLDQPAGA